MFVSFMKEEESEKGWRDREWGEWEIGRQYWDDGVRVGDSWMNRCFVMRVLFDWIEVVDWNGWMGNRWSGLWLSEMDSEMDGFEFRVEGWVLIAMYGVRGGRGWLKTKRRRKLDIGFDSNALVDASGQEWSYGDEDYEGMHCMVFQREYEGIWLWMVIVEGKWDSWKGVHLLVLFLSCRDCIWRNRVVWMRIEENWGWRRICFRIWVWREDEEMILWLELNGGIVGMIQNAFLCIISDHRKGAEDFILHMRGMKGRVIWDGLVVVKEEWDFSSVEREMKNGEWRDADSSWVEFESRDPFHLLHAFSLPFFMIRGASNAYPPCG